MTPRSDARTPTESAHPIVVGIGASAGGLEALTAFFGAIAAKTDLAFVVVMHLDPTHDSLVAQLLAKSTAIHVEQARDRQPLEADHAYIAPPNCLLTVDQGLIHLQAASDRHGVRGGIDHFFRSLADAQHGRAVGIILSGSGADGTLGLRAIKAEGGLVMAQAPETAAQSGMPDSAIATGLVDLVLPPPEMPEALRIYTRGMRLERGASPAPADTCSREDLDAVLSVLRRGNKGDFRGYKEGMLQRRIERRMRLQQIDSTGEYATFLRAHPDEVDRLFQDLLIGVTRFFRDPATFDALATTVLAPLLRETDADASIRVWVPGCSTGEEAYSIAIVAAEQAAAARSGRHVQIFATDLDQDAIEIARAGVYPESIAIDVGSQRLKRFFTHENDRYTVVKSIRESIVFGVQNVISDPPLSNFDLVSCRNVLIYLEPALHEKLMRLFHFALKPGGYLLLGSAETAESLGAWFAPSSKGDQLFQRLGTSKPLRSSDAWLQPSPLHSLAKATAPPDLAVATLAQQVLLSHLAPAAVVVTGGGQIARVYGALDSYLTFPSGDATLDVLALARDPLKPALRAALDAPVHRDRPIAIDTDLERGRTRSTLRITVWALGAEGAAECPRLIVFESPSPVASEDQQLPGDASTQDRLAAELTVARREQQRLLAQFEQRREALSAANDEAVATNEELQSANEELATSKEELQSMNEELTTLNATLREKVSEIIAVNDDLENLFRSADTATVFLDEASAIARFTPAAARLLNARASDVGRPLGELATSLADVDMVQDARAVLAGVERIEKEVRARDGRHYLLRVLPYRSERQAAKGVVLTLSDVTTLKRTQQELEDAKAALSVDLQHMSRLHVLSMRQDNPVALPLLVDEIVKAAIDITGADMGWILALNDTGALTIAAHANCPRPLLESRVRVPPDGTSIEDLAIARRERVVINDVPHSPVLAGAPSLNALMAAGVRAVQATPLMGLSGELVGVLSTHSRTSGGIADDDLRWLDLLAHHAANVIERRRLADAAEQATNRLNEQVKERTKWLLLLHDISKDIDQAPKWSDTLRMIISRICKSEGWQIGYVYLPAADATDQIVNTVHYSADARFAPFHTASRHLRHTIGDLLPGRVFALGRHMWVNGEAELRRAIPARAAVAEQVGLQSAVALPVRIGQTTVAVLEMFSDRPHPENEELMRLMNDVSTQLGRVIDQENTLTQVAETIWREQQDLLYTLHDSLGQQLTGLGMLATSVQGRFEGADADGAETARQIARIAQDALETVRQLSKGMFPGGVEGGHLLESLRDLALATQAMHKLECTVECDTPVPITDDHVATQLYRIAQEGVTNAVRHAGASHVTIGLHAEAGATTLTVSDDGVGILHRASAGRGMGLRIMRHRATTIGATFSIGMNVRGGALVKVVVGTSPPAHHGSGDDIRTPHDPGRIVGT